MLEFLDSLGGVAVSVGALLTGGSMTTLLARSVLASKMKRKYDSLIHQSNCKDTQIEQLKSEMGELKKCMGILTSTVVTTQLAQKSLDPSVKKQVAGYVKDINTLTGIKLDETVNKAVDVLTNLNFVKEDSEKKDAILEGVSKTQDVLNEINKISESFIDKLEV